MKGDKQEFYAGSVQEAVAKAAISLGVSPEQVDYTTLDEGSSGFLGIGTRDARISVSIPDKDAEPAAPPVEVDTPVFTPEPTVQQTEDPTPHASEDAVPEEDNAGTVEEAPPDLIVAIDGFATELLQKMGFDATVDAYDAGEVVQVDIGTKETGLLIGQKGETIDSVQYLINVAVYKDRPFLKRITVDTEGYRQRRVGALQGMAHRTARRAQRERRPIDLPPMAASERRVIHMYLKENPNVSTSSKGGEDERRVVVSPND